MTVEEIRNLIHDQQEELKNDEPESYFKYCSDKKEVIEDIFSHQIIRFTQPRALNDPLEFSPTFRFNSNSAYQWYQLQGKILPSIEFFYRVQIIESQINRFGILSLTKTPDSFEMWSQYSNGHKGFVIEFKKDFFKCKSMKSKDGQEYPVRKIQYVDDYSINLDNISSGSGNIFAKDIHDELFYKKTARWKYENEYRVVRPLTDCPEYVPPKKKVAYTDLGIYLFPFDTECISGIVLGAAMSIENKHTLFKYCKKQNIPLLQAHIMRDHNDRWGKPSTVIMYRIDNQNEDMVIRSSPQLFCSDTINYGNHTTLIIKDIKEIPYYQSYPDLVNNLL